MSSKAGCSSSAARSCCGSGSSGCSRRTPGLTVDSHAVLPADAQAAAVAVLCERGAGDLAAGVTSALDRVGREVVVVLSVPDVHNLLDCVAAGASGFVLEGDARADLLAAVRAAAARECFIAPVAPRAAARLPPRRTQPLRRRRSHAAAPARGRPPDGRDRRRTRGRAEDRAQPLLPAVPASRRTLTGTGRGGRRAPRPARLSGLAHRYNRDSNHDRAEVPDGRAGECVTRQEKRCRRSRCTASQYEREGVVVIPAARVRGFGGGGGGEGSQPGEGDRVWIRTRLRPRGPTGRSLRDPRRNGVEWKPAIDATQHRAARPGRPDPAAAHPAARRRR